MLLLSKEVTMLGDYVRSLRKSRGWTQEYLAERANVDQTFISQVENNKTRPSVAYLQRLADGFAVPVGELLAAAGVAPPPPAEAEPDLHRLSTYLEHDPELQAQLATIRASETPEVYDQIVRGLIDVWKAQLRLVLDVRDRAGASTYRPPR